MESLIPAFTGIFLPIILGLLSRIKNFIHPDNKSVIMQFAVRVAVPFLVFNSISRMELQTAGQFLPMSLGLFVQTGIVWCQSYLLLTILEKWISWIRAYKAELLLMSMGGNIGYICWRLQELIIGTEGLQRGIFYTSFIWPSLLSFSFLTLFVLKLHQKKKIDKKYIAGNLTPLLSMLALGFVVALSGVELPNWLMDFSSSFGSLAVPIILYCMGLSISVKSSARSMVTLIPYLLIRQGLWIFSAFLLLRLSFYDAPSRGVLMINALAPLGVTPLIIGEMFDLDTDFMADSTTVSTVYFLLVLPVLFLFWSTL